MPTATKIELVEMMFKVSRLIKEEMSYANDIVHLSILQIQTLIYIDKNKRVSMSDIAGQFHIELSSATSLINKLYDQKLVERYQDNEDRRLVRISLTIAGKALLKEAMQQRRKKLERTLSYLSDKEREDLFSILGTLNIKLQMNR